MASNYIEKDLGIVTAYGDAVAGGYSGTREQFQNFLASGLSRLNVGVRRIEKNVGSLQSKANTIVFLNRTDLEIDGYGVVGLVGVLPTLESNGASRVNVAVSWAVNGAHTTITDSVDSFIVTLVNFGDSNYSDVVIQVDILYVRN